MTGATNKNAPLDRQGFRQRGNYCYNENLAQLFRHVNNLCQRLEMSREKFQQAACVFALMFRDYAPPAVQPSFTGKPSLYSERAKTLALAFLCVYIEADDRLGALETDKHIDAQECWRVALKLTGGGL